MNTNLINKMSTLSQAELYQALYTDPLTGALNRRALEEMDYRFIAIIDLDSLKYINDHHGHRAGDQALCKLSDAIADEFGTSNTYRLSGDEFAVIGNSSIELVNGLNQVRRHYASFSFGVGRDLVEADRQLYLEKTDRERYGLRARRGETPPWEARKSANRLAA